MTSSSPSRDHIRGLDTIRFIAALWVAFGHGASLPLKIMLAGKGPFAEAVASANGVLFNGVAAVMVFFVISGFCIHHAWIRSPELSLKQYFLRRYSRIIAPLLVALFISHLFGKAVSDALGAILWSIYCEIIYYTIYPALRYSFQRWGINYLLLASSLISLGLIASRWSFVYVWQFGLAGTWLLCLPTWLIGCLIAQRQADGTLITAPGSLWIWRPVGILLGSLSLILLYHTRLEIGLPVMMLIFSFYLYFWIQKEISSLKTAKIAFLEWAGTWSYSLYLIHNMVIAKFEEMALPIAPLAVWAAKLASILALSYLFFSLVEFPAHRFARWVGRRPVSP